MSVAIAPKLSATLDGFSQHAPAPVLKTVNGARADAQAIFDPNNAPQVGSILPEFSLKNATGQTVTLSGLLSKSETKGLLITFYRGGWCPFCSIELHGLQEHLGEFTAAGVTLVAISPEVPDQTLSTKEKNELQFEVLSDVGTKYASKLGIMWQVPEDLQSVLANFGHDLKDWNGNEEYKVPIPTNILVDKESKVRNVFVEPDWSKRLEPATAVEWARAL